MSIAFDRENLKGFVSEKDIENIFPRIKKAHDDLHAKKGPGREYTGWVDLPGKTNDAFIKELTQFGSQMRKSADCLISIGIGGSYLGIRATVEFLGGSPLPLYYAGHNLCVDNLSTLLKQLKDKNVVVTVISKSGETTEPALAFRIVKNFLKEKYSDQELKKRIVCVTDAKKGAMRKIADKEGYKTFVIPDDVGGRFSVLTPVGLVPLAVAGLDIQSLIDGARQGEKDYGKLDLKTNIAYQYAALRYLLHHQGKMIEVLSSFYDNTFYVNEWFKQLFGESEGKEGKGIFPTAMSMTTDLHSLGQLIQEGIRNVFETFLMIDEPKHTLKIPREKDDPENFNCVADKDLDYVNKQAYKATAMAHFEGGVPNMTITLCKADAFHLGQLYYFFEKAVAVSGYLSGVNPFTQPGVEAYKNKMFALLGRK